MSDIKFQPVYQAHENIYFAVLKFITIISVVSLKLLANIIEMVIY